MKKKKKKISIKKLFKNNFFNIATCLIALFGLIISIISLNESIFQNKRNIYPDIIVGSLENTIIGTYWENYDSYQTTFHNDNVDTKMKIVNIGDGIAKNIEFTWDEENSKNLKSLIEAIDKNNLVSFEEMYPLLRYDYPFLTGAVNISKSHYKRDVDYLLSEKNFASDEIIDFPFEYIIFLDTLCNLSLQYDYDINQLMNGIKLYLNIKYHDIENNEYKKTIPIEIHFDKIVTKYHVTFTTYINTEL